MHERRLVLALLPFLFLVVPAGAAQTYRFDRVHAAPWRVDEAASRVGFAFTQAGAESQGAFRDFAAEIDFDPKAPKTSSVRAVIEVASITTENAKRDAVVKGPEWLGAEAYPEAIFQSTAFAAKGGDRYEVQGNLTLKGETRRVALPMQIAVEGDTATASGTITIDRTAYGVGTDQWAANLVVGKEVGIVLEFKAKRAE